MCTPIDDVKRAFGQFDSNGDGVISREELGRVLQFCDADVWTDANVNALLETVDTNTDGKIQFDEFIRYATASGTGTDDVYKHFQIVFNKVKAKPEDGLVCENCGVVQVALLSGEVFEVPDLSKAACFKDLISRLQMLRPTPKYTQYEIAGQFGKVNNDDKVEPGFYFAAVRSGYPTCAPGDRVVGKYHDAFFPATVESVECDDHGSWFATINWDEPDETFRRGPIYQVYFLEEVKQCAPDDLQVGKHVWQGPECFWPGTSAEIHEGWCMVNWEAYEAGRAPSSNLYTHGDPCGLKEAWHKVDRRDHLYYQSDLVEYSGKGVEIHVEMASETKTLTPGTRGEVAYDQREGDLQILVRFEGCGMRYRIVPCDAITLVREDP